MLGSPGHPLCEHSNKTDHNHENSRLAYAGAQQSGRQLRTGGAVQEGRQAGQEEAAGGEAETSQEEPGARSRDEDHARVSFAYSNIMILCLRSIAFIS
jgi:hypothetical protein